ncbi:hypothetical protein SKTS_34650 [Sulfurimicrobium lacus]|uniref:DUF2789 domain-containing protein n=1 Tax=Sulfurimicrobium lacus TaxID=2715678 RepID=A0A6F8VIN8_9PROT|nr:DUF2789 domain-containing protein [Sulfurimicrobium lacus]BCB28579.1 hypothetical protein SKTS_34650 [Sulfurimicrobium lacus]
MEAPIHTMSDLFAQLGLASDQASIDQFIAAHQALTAGVPLSEAPFWTSAQTEFLREELLEDADWAEVIDALNVELHPMR